MTNYDDIEALVLLEIDGLARAVRLHDAALKKAPVKVLASAPVSPGKAILIFSGEVAAVEEARATCLELAGSRLLDDLYLPGVHRDVAAAFHGERRPRGEQALAVIETETAASAIVAADAACKCTPVAVGRLHLANGFGGRGFFTLWGEQHELEAALQAAHESIGDKLLDSELIAAPHDELEDMLFSRPWPLDPTH